MKISLLPLLALVVPLRAAELNPSQIPATAQWVLHADLDSMRASETGKAVFSRIEADHGARLRAFSRMFAIQLLSDLHGITLYGDGGRDRAVALIHGDFDRAHMEDVVGGADKHSSENYAGFTIHTWEDQGHMQHAAFSNDKLLAFSREKDLLKGALDTLKENAPAAADPFFTAGGDKPFVDGSAQLAHIDTPPDGARLLGMAKTLHVAATEQAGRFSIRLGVETAGPAVAERLGKILEGVFAFAQVTDANLEALHLRTDVAVTPDKSGLTASVSLPVAEWLGLLQKTAAKNPAH